MSPVAQSGGNGSFVDSGYQTFTFDLTPYISAATTIRFSVGDGVDGDGDGGIINDDIVYIDNFQVALAGASYWSNASPPRCAA